MISLLQFSDKAGRRYSQGNILLALDNGPKIYECIDNEMEMMVWIPESLMPRKFELQNMCDEKIFDTNIKKFLIWPDKLLFDNRGECCGFITMRPENLQKVKPISRLIEISRWFDRPEKVNNAIVGLNLARLFKAIRDTEHGYSLGVISPDSFWYDDDYNVYYMESYNCARNLDGDIKSYYIAPELLLQNNWRGKFTDKTDSFIYALILFQILTGKFPFNSIENIEKVDIEYIWKLMCDGISIFYDMSDVCSETIIKEIKGYSEHILNLFLRALNYCGLSDYSEGRPAIDEWMEALSEFINNNSDESGGSYER